MQTILLTVEGPQRSVDLEVPGEISISELIPLLLETCGSPQIKLAPLLNPSRWVLGPKDGDKPLDLTHSLIDSEVMDGAVLVLQDIASWASQGERKAHWRPQSLSPSGSTGGIGIKWDVDGLLSR